MVVHFSPLRQFEACKFFHLEAAPPKEGVSKFCLSDRQRELQVFGLLCFRYVSGALPKPKRAFWMNLVGCRCKIIWKIQKYSLLSHIFALKNKFFIFMKKNHFFIFGLRPAYSFVNFWKQSFQKLKNTFFWKFETIYWKSGLTKLKIMVRVRCHRSLECWEYFPFSKTKIENLGISA